MADFHGRRALSRFHQRSRGECARSLPSASGGRAAGTGDQAVAYVEPVQEPGWRAAGRAALRAKLCRVCVLRQFRGRGGGMRHQAHPQIPGGQRASRALSHHHLRWRVSRTNAGDAGRDRLAEISRGLRSAGRRLRPGRARRSRSSKKGNRPTDRRDPDRALAERGRRARGTPCVLSRLARALR